jgi:acyl carrier protein phosphodiesterase
MNFLAHLYLSRNDEELMVGNILADFSKGIRHKNLSANIQKGVEIHRKIDHFTDTHPIVQRTKKLLQPRFNHYSPVIADVFYDHFLASQWAQFSDENLYDFANRSYLALKKHRFLFPLRFQQALVYGRFRKVLISYTSIEGIDKAFNRMLFRTRFTSNLEKASIELKKNYLAYQSDFSSFFPELIAYSNSL